jgi:two-component sensor histidine kinase
LTIEAGATVRIAIVYAVVAYSKGLGMKIIKSLVKQIHGELRVLPGENDRGTRFTVTFCSTESNPKAT